MHVTRASRRGSGTGSSSGETGSPSGETGGSLGDLASSPFRVDRDRVSSSAFFARLGGVTQVVSPSGSGLLLHNRLTHSLKVAQVARAIAERLNAHEESVQLIDRLGGCDRDVAEAAGLAHDLGHPPFGHLGESVLDRIARQWFGLPDGFEGNAQSFRIVCSIDVLGTSAEGLDLTAAVRASLLKYPWTRLWRPDPHPRHLHYPPRGAAEPGEALGTGSMKFSSYVTEFDDLLDCRVPFAGAVPEWQQTVEASVMDTADDIAYAIHDLEDFHRVGVLQHTTVSHELTEWLGRSVEFANFSDADAASAQGPGWSLELLRRRLHAKDGWIADDDAFVNAVKKVVSHLVTKLLAVPFDRSRKAEQAVAEFSGEWTRRLVEGVRTTEAATTRSGHVVLRAEQWHEVQVLKFVHSHFVLQRPDLALHQRGQDRLLSKLVEALDNWLIDRRETARVPHRLRDLFDHARRQFAAVRAEAPAALVQPGARPLTGAAGDEAVERMARGRAVIDFVASLTDEQAAALLEALSGRATQSWADTFVL